MPRASGAVTATIDLKSTHWETWSFISRNAAAFPHLTGEETDAQRISAALVSANHLPAGGAESGPAFHGGVPCGAWMPALPVWNSRSGSDAVPFLRGYAPWSFTWQQEGNPGILSTPQLLPGIPESRGGTETHLVLGTAEMTGFSAPPPFPRVKLKRTSSSKVYHALCDETILGVTHSSLRRSGDPNALKDQFLSCYLCHSATS